MPVVQKSHFICPVTGTEVVSETPNMPAQWGNVNGEVFSPAGIVIIARRILNHPEAGYAAITSRTYPDPELDPPAGD